MLPVDPSQGGKLVGPLLDDEPSDFLAIRQALYDHGNRPELVRELREVLRNERESPDRRLRAGMALVGLLGSIQRAGDSDLRESAGFLAEQFVADLMIHPERYNDWVEALKPARSLLVLHLAAIFRRPSENESPRSLSATILANYAAGDPATLLDLLLSADMRQFPVVLRAISAFRQKAEEQLRELIALDPSEGASPEERNASVSRQANAVIALYHWGDSGTLWRWLRQRPDPLLRTYLIDRLSRLTPDPLVLLDRLERESDVAARRALILVLGGLPREQLAILERPRDRSPLRRFPR